MKYLTILLVFTILTGCTIYVKEPMNLAEEFEESNKKLDELIKEAEKARDEAFSEGNRQLKELQEYIDNRGKTMRGVASYYDYVLDSGWSSVGHYVCATRDFIRYSYVRATNVANGKSVICKVTDFGPDASVFPERIIDLSSTAFKAIEDIKMGVATVIVKQLENYEI